MGLLPLNTPINNFHFVIHKLLVCLRTWASGEVVPGKQNLSYLHPGQDGIQIFLRALIMFTGKHWTQQITYDTCIMAVLTAMIQYSNCDRMRDKKKLTSHTMPETLIAQF